MAQSVVGADVIKRAVHLACRAPSLHNSQPWRWTAEYETVHLISDPTRVGRFTDSTGREVLISCGAALDHFRVAMADEGWETHVDRFPNPNDREHLAALSFSPMSFVTDAHRARADAIRRRRTNRLPFAAPTNWDSFDPVLRNAVNPAVAMLDVIPDGARPALATASRLTEELRKYDSGYHAELRWWKTQMESLQGIPLTALVTETEDQQLDVSRHFPTSARGARRQETGQDRSKILVLSTYDDSRPCALAAGEALSTVLLECTMAGLATCTLTHMIEVNAAREIVRRETGKHGMPQLLIRVGEAPATVDALPMTPRRPWTDVLEIHQ